MERLLQSASSFSGDVDWLVLLITILVGFWFVVAEVLLFSLIVRFRHREGVPAQDVTGRREKLIKRWVTIPHLLILACDVVIIIAAIRVWVHIKQTLPPADVTVRVIGQQWAWTFVHPGPDGQLGTADDLRTADDLHVEVGKAYHFQLEATDVLHSFSIPVFRLKQDAVPGRVITGWFKPTKTGTFDIQCAEICGIGHGIMAGRIHVESPGQHAEWMRQAPVLVALAARTE
jgi:cytochrome c oxidase subunit 2